MKVLILVVVLAFYLLVPALVVKLCRKVKFFGKVGAILTLYFLGVLLGNLFIFRIDGLGEILFPLQNAMVSIAIPLAIPLILFACDFRHWPAGKAMVALVIGLVSVFAVSALGYWIFKDYLGEEGKAIAGMAVGVYTGGTPNLASIKMMLGAREETYVMLNTFDMLASFLYLIFLLAVGIRLIREWLPAAKERRKERRGKGSTEPRGKVTKMAQSEEEMYRDVFTKKHFLPTLKALGLSVLIVGISLGISYLISGKVNTGEVEHMAWEKQYLNYIDKLGYENFLIEMM